MNYRITFEQDADRILLRRICTHDIFRERNCRRDYAFYVSMGVDRQLLDEAMADPRPARGFTHDFYPYPARMSPFVARYLIGELSAPADWVMDPFMGSGTVPVEALAAGRNAVGSDISPLAHLLTSVRTRGLSRSDLTVLRDWIDDGGGSAKATLAGDWEALPNGPMLGRLAATAAGIPFARRREAAKACLLVVGKRLMDDDGNKTTPSRVQARLRQALQTLADGTEQLVLAAGQNGLARRQLSPSRILTIADATRLHNNPVVRPLLRSVRLILTSPPYPGVHVLYHRWQIQSRRETAAPFWIAGAVDGRGPAYYTMGGRGRGAEDRYFSAMNKTLETLTDFLAPDGRICLLIAFPHLSHQLPRMLAGARSAGLVADDTRFVSRQVPNRKWYARQQKASGAAEELLLILRRVR